jgi:hypothetical protein
MSARDEFSRLAYLASERGGTLTTSADGLSYTVALATDTAPRFVTLRNAPLSGRDGENIALI